MSLCRILFYFLLCTSLSATAQFKNLKLDEVTMPGHAIDPGIAINHKDPRNIVVTSSPNNVYHSVDGGLSWKKRGIQSNPVLIGHATLIADNKGNFYCLAQADVSGVRRIIAFESKDNGESWSEGDFVDNDKNTRTKDQRMFQVTSDPKGNMYLTWTQTDTYGSADSTCRSVIVYSKSSNGKKWSTPVQISQTSGGCIEDNQMTAGSSPAISSDGKVYITWSNQQRIFLDRSFNGGDMWLSSDIAIAKQPGGWNFEIPGQSNANGVTQLCVDQSKSLAGGSVYLSWADQQSGATDTDIWFIRSHNGGDNWTSPMRVNNDDSKHHQFSQSMTVDAATGYIYIVYLDRRAKDDLSTDVYLAYSGDGGSTFQNTLISESSFTPEPDKNLSYYTSIAAHKGVVTPVWTRMDGGKTSVWTTVIKQEQLPKSNTTKK